MNAAYFNSTLKLCFVAIRHIQLGHPIERHTVHQQLRGLSGEAARRDFLPENDLLAEHRGLRQAAAMIANFFLPSRTPDLSNAAQVLITHQSFGFAVAVLPNLRVALWRDGRRGVPRAERLVAVALVIGAVAGDLANFVLDL